MQQTKNSDAWGACKPQTGKHPQLHPITMRQYLVPEWFRLTHPCPAKSHVHYCLDFDISMTGSKMHNPIGLRLRTVFAWVRGLFAVSVFGVGRRDVSKDLDCDAGIG
jgi:hypothetical protein